MPFETNQWFFFDRRTKTIRPVNKKNFVISNQRGQRFLQNKAAVVRKWVGEAYQRSAYYGGSTRNVRNVPGQCLDVVGASNTNRRHVTWKSCTNGANQGWMLDRSGVHFPRYPLRNGLKFQIKSRMSTNRALFVAEHIGSHQYRLRIQNNNPYDIKQWFVFDWRTRSIRSAANTRHAMSIQKNGKNWRYFHYSAVTRKYTGSYLQKMRWFEGSRRNIRDVNIRCLDVHGNSNTHRRHVHWYKCHKGLNQAWYVDQKGYNYPGQPLASGVRFQIKSKMTGNRALYYAEHVGSYQYRLRSQDNNPSDKKQWFTFDKRTQSIRAFYRREFCLGNKIG